MRTTRLIVFLSNSLTTAGLVVTAGLSTDATTSRHALAGTAHTSAGDPGGAPELPEAAGGLVGARGGRNSAVPCTLVAHGAAGVSDSLGECGGEYRDVFGACRGGPGRSRKKSRSSEYVRDHISGPPWSMGVVLGSLGIPN